MGLMPDPFTTRGDPSFPEGCWNGVDVVGAELVPTEKALAWPSGEGERDVRLILRSNIDWGV